MTSSSRDAAVARAAVAQYLVRAGRAGLDAAKTQILQDLGPGDRVHARINGCDVATVSVTDPRPRETVTVTDEGAFVQWVLEHHPEAIQTVVADWFRSTTNLKALIETGGEIPDGVEITETIGTPTVQVRISAAQEHAMGEIIAATPVAGYLDGGEPA